MADRSIAQNEVETLFGCDALNDAVWRDVRLFETTTAKLATTIWKLDTRDEQHLYEIVPVYMGPRSHAPDERCNVVIRQLRAELGPARTASCAAAYLLHPQFGRWSYNGYDQDYARRRAVEQILRTVAELILADSTPPDWIQRLGQRLYDLCNVPRLASPPDFIACIDYLIDSPEAATDQRVAALLDALTVGDWRKGWQAIRSLGGRPGGGVWRLLEAVVPDPIADRLLHLEPVVALRRYWESTGAELALTLLARLDAREQLSLPSFQRLVEAVPDCLTSLSGLRQPQPVNVAERAPSSPWRLRLRDNAFLDRVQRLVDDVLWAMIAEFRPESWAALNRIEQIAGGRYLLRLAEEVQQRGLPKLHASKYGPWYGKQDAEATIVTLLGKLRRRDDDDAEKLVQLLRRISVPALLAVLPHARSYEAELCAALNWDGCLPLVELLHRLETVDPAASTDPTAGLLPRDAVLRIVEQLGEEHTRIVLDAFSHHRSSACFLVEATLGWNRSDVRRHFGRRKPLAARALGLLPLDKGDTVLKRYLALTNFQREANASGAGKKAAERAAAQTGLANLALHAGFADATRLEWSMQAQLGVEGVSLGRQWEIEGYRLTLVQRDGHPALEVQKGKKVLKRTPAAVTRDYVYREVRATLDQLKDQQRRYCQAFLNAMRRGDALSGEELDILRREPLAVALLERLVLRDEAGAFGLFRSEDCSLEGYHGERIPVAGRVWIAHPYDLAQAATLGDWQAEVVRREIVQPFKQVFRELYLLTPAEVAAGVQSSRFAGRRLKGRQSTAVLANLGWLIGGGDEVNKPFYDLGFAAYFETGAGWYYGDEGDDWGGVTGALTFWPLDANRYDYDWSQRADRRIKLSDVPPLALSEVLRDLDLVTVVAHQSDEHGSSSEVLHRRADLVRATVAALGLPTVAVEEPHVRVQGSRASYRIHLATAAIHIESGAYLCIVPSAKQRKSTYLPFEDGGDPISSELVSKVLLLANDQTIDDPTILAQIPPARRAA